MIGDHMVKSWSITQAVIALSSGEAEYYGIVKGGSAGLGLRSVLKDSGVEFRLSVSADSSAAKGISTRRGLGKIRHIEVNQLWVQEKVGSGEIEIKKISGYSNLADALTKPVENDVLKRHMIGTSQTTSNSRHEIMPETVEQQINAVYAFNSQTFQVYSLAPRARVKDTGAMARLDRFDSMGIQDDYVGKYKFATQYEYARETKYREDKVSEYTRSISDAETQLAGIEENKKDVRQRLDHENDRLAKKTAEYEEYKRRHEDKVSSLIDENKEYSGQRAEVYERLGEFEQQLARHQTLLDRAREVQYNIMELPARKKFKKEPSESDGAEDKPQEYTESWKSLRPDDDVEFESTTPVEKRDAETSCGDPALVLLPRAKIQPR